jgi:hypothetical protein
MDKGLVTLIGMSIAYLASLLGMGFAYWAWRRHHRRADRKEEAR